MLIRLLFFEKLHFPQVDLRILFFPLFFLRVECWRALLEDSFGIVFYNQSETNPRKECLEKHFEMTPFLQSNQVKRSCR